MGRRIRLFAGRAPWCKGFALCSALFLTASLADAGGAPLALGKVTTRVAPRDQALRNAFRSAVERELASIDLSSIKPVKPADRYILSASLVKMETSADGERARTTCVVSATLTRERGGALHAIIDGRARAEDAPSEARSVELSAMRAAVHSALVRIPDAIR
jgi:hypothetical protein